MRREAAPYALWEELGEAVGVEAVVGFGGGEGEPGAGGDFLGLEGDFGGGVGGEEVAEVEVPVGVLGFGGVGGDAVGVDVDGVVAIGEGMGEDGDAGFFEGFAGGAGDEGFVALEVAAGLEVEAEEFVVDEEDVFPGWVEDDGAGGDVAVEVLAVEEGVVGGEVGGEGVEAFGFRGVAGEVGGEEGLDVGFVHEGVAWRDGFR